MDKIIILLYIILISGYSDIYAQKVILKDVLDPYLDQVQAIEEEGRVLGYFVFTQQEKTEKKQYKYQIQIFDTGLVEKFQLELIRPKDFSLLETGFNQSHMAFYFLDYKNKQTELVLVSHDGIITGSFKSEKLSNKEILSLEEIYSSGTNPFGGSIMGIPERGFVLFIPDSKKGIDYHLTLIDHAGNKKWSTNLNPSGSRDYTLAFPLAASKERMVCQLQIRDHSMSSSFKVNEIILIDAETGNTIQAMENFTEKYELSPSGCSMFQEQGDFLIFGEYFESGANVIKSRSEGIFIHRYNPQGKRIAESYNSWSKELKKAIKSTQKEKSEKNMTLAVLEMFETADHKVFAVCEQFKKTVDAGGVALNLLSGTVGVGNNASLAKALLGNLVVIEFNPEFEFKAIHEFEKEPVSIYLFSGSEYYSTAFIGSYLKSIKSFDFRFINHPENSNEFSLVYVNRERDEMNYKITHYVGNITYSQEKFNHQTITIKSKPTDFSVLPHHPGAVVIYEYFKKEKKAILRIVKNEKQLQE